MLSKEYSLHDTIFAPITPKFGGSVCVFRISGAKSFEFLNSTGKAGNFPSKNAFFTNIIKDNSVLDEVIITAFKNPHSFTGEDILEIAIHASDYIYKQLVEIFTEKYGFRFANPGEFLYRALINGKIDLTKAESINLLIKSSTQNQHKLAIRGIDGKISQKYQEWHLVLVNILSLLEANIDFSDQEIPREIMQKIHTEIHNLQASMQEVLRPGSLISKVVGGFKIAILGKPNAGKSSLINALTNSEIAIVSPTPGTTRDLITAQLDISGYLVNLIDTAGIRDDVDSDIEKEGVIRAKNAAKSADIRIFLFEKGVAEEGLLGEFYQNQDILIASKSDLIFGEIPGNLTKLSIGNAEELQGVIRNISAAIVNKTGEIDNLICTSERQIAIISRCHNIINSLDLTAEIEILAEEIRFVLANLAEIFGITSPDDILGNIFSKFCIGK